MKIAILGATGLLGHTLVRRSAEQGLASVGTRFSQEIAGFESLDVRDSAAVRSFFERHRPDAAFLTASNPYVDYCETHPRQTRTVNVAGSRNVIEAAERVGSRLVFFSSDYVFDGRAQSYREEDPPCPLNEYGRQKLAVERALGKRLPQSLILRVCGIYGWEKKKKNFVYQLRRRLAAGERPTLPCDHVYRPTFAEDVSEAALELLRQKRSGIFHVAGEDLVSRFELGRAIAQAYGLDPSSIKPGRLADAGSPTPRPLRTDLSTEKLKAAIGARMNGLQEGLRRMVETEGKLDAASPEEARRVSAA